MFGHYLGSLAAKECEEFLGHELDGVWILYGIWLLSKVFFSPYFEGVPLLLL